MQTLTISRTGGRSNYTLSPTRNTGELQDKLAKCNGKSRKSAIRDTRTKGNFPRFEAGMSTADYVRAFESDHLCAWQWAQLNDAPCTLYSGEDTCETLPDGFDTWEDFDAAPGSSTADAEPVDAAEPVAPDDAIAPAIVAGAELDAPAPSARAEPYPGCEPTAATVYRVHLATAAHSLAIDPTFSGMLRRPKSPAFLEDFAAPAVRAHRLAIARSVRAERAKRASLEGSEPQRMADAMRARIAPTADALREAAAELEARAARVPTERADDYRGAAAMLRADADAAPGIVPGFASRGARMLQAAIARSAARGIEVGACGAPLATHSQSAAVADPLATHSEPAPDRPVYANDYLAWRDVENDRAEPDEYQARLIECFGEVKAGGLFYNSDTYPATAALMTERYGYPDWRGDRGQSDGVQDLFGMDCYRANCVIRARAERERERSAAATFTVGQRFARLIFNDGKQRTAAELVTLDPAGFACKIKAKSGRNSVEVTCSAYALSLAVIRAEERGKVLAAKRANARPELIAPMPAEPTPVPGKLDAAPAVDSGPPASDSSADPAEVKREADRAAALADAMARFTRGTRVTAEPAHYFDGQPVAGWPSAQFLGTVRECFDNRGMATVRVKWDSGRTDLTSAARLAIVPLPSESETDPLPADSQDAPDVAKWRAELRSVEDAILRAAPARYSNGRHGCDIEAAARSRSVPADLKRQRKYLRASLQGARMMADAVQPAPVASAPPPVESAPLPCESAPETVMLSHVLGALQRIAPDGIPDAAMLAREADRIEATAERMRDAMPDYSATCATVARDLRALADPALDDDETIPAPLDGLDVAELDDMVEFERAGGIAQPIAPAYRDDAPRATPTPSLRISPSDPRARIPARFAPVYLLQA